VRSGSREVWEKDSQCPSREPMVAHTLKDTPDTLAYEVRPTSLATHEDGGLHDPAALGSDESAAASLRARGMRRAPRLHGPEDRACLVSPPGAADFLRQRLRKFEEYFGVKTHEDIQAS
jgi:hypothetical protein